MREILFRGKRVDNGEWVEGYYVNSIGPDCEPNETRHYIVTYPGDWHEVYTSTVGQYTGLTDKNGKRVFEGDILRQHTDDVNPTFKILERVYWNVSKSAWCTTPYKDIDHLAYDQLCVWDTIKTEVISNIHDNADLLK